MAAIIGIRITTLLGRNNLGKSVILSALRAVAYGVSGESCIRHGAAQARVEIGIEDGITIRWERRRKGSGKVSWQRIGPGGEVEIETVSGRDVPDWVTAALSITPVDEFDVQLGHQKQPVFVLDRSPRLRAQILSVGREAGHLQAMQEGWRDALRGDADTVRQGEAELTVIAARLAAFDGFDALAAAVSAAGTDLGALFDAEAAAEGLARQIGALAAAETRLGAVRNEAKVLDALPEPPPLRPTGDLRAVMAGIGRARAILDRTRTAAAVLDALPAAAPTFDSIADLTALIGRLSRLSAIMKLAEPPDLPPVPALAETAALAAAIARLADLDGALAQGERDLAALAREAASADAAINALLAEHGRLCPLCGQAVAGAADLLGTGHAGTGHGRG